MATSSTTNLDSSATKALQHLISINIDSQKGFQTAAAEVKDPEIKRLFDELSSVRGRQAAQLQSLLSSSGEDPTHHGSVSGNIHRWWITAKQSLTGGDVQSVLNEAERGEDSIKHEYERHLKDLESSPAADVVRRQFDEVKQGHDQVKQLRDRRKNPA